MTPTIVYAREEGLKFKADLNLVVVSCPTCFITYAIPERLRRSALDWPGNQPNGWSICCPLGHTWHYTGESLDQKLKKAQEQARMARERAEAERDLRQDTERRLSAQKGATTKARKRAAAALCPCCNRSFVQIRRHMAAKHPDYDPAKG